MADLVYPLWKGRQAGTGTPVDFDTDTLKVMLVTSTYVATSAATLKTHDFRDDVTNEVTGTGYTAGGATLASKTLTASGDNFVFDAADVTWTTATITARGAVLYKSVGTAATDPIIALFDFGSDITSTAGTFTLQWNASGILSFS